MTTNTIKQSLTINYEIKYDPNNDWYCIDDETYQIDHSQKPTTAKEIALCLLDSIIRRTEKMAIGNLEDVGCEEVESFEESVVNEVKEFLGLDQEGDLEDNYASLVRSVLTTTTLSKRIEVTENEL